MTTSIFDRIYSYLERENKNSKENFLIEIFAYCLETDHVFFADFLLLLEINYDKNYSVKTQVVYEFGRPDIEIHLDKIKTNILIECKIEHFERPNQLNDYKKILLQNGNIEKHLVYLTRYYEHKEIDKSQVHFHQNKWADIYSIINDDNKQITQELKQYIKEQNMADSNNFLYQDLSVLKTITSTISKMDEVLDGIKPVFEQKIGKFSKDSSRSTRLSEERYVNWHSVIKEGVQQYSIETGFYWWEDDIYIALRIYIPNKAKNKEAARLNKFFENKLKNWEPEHWDEYFNYWHYKSVAQFIVDDEEQIPAMIDFLKEGIKDLEILKGL